MKKIIIINHYGITPNLPGATRHYDMAKKFASKNEYEIEFWMCGYNHHTGKNGVELKNKLFQSKRCEDGINIVKIRSTPYRKSSLLRQLNITVFDIITAIKVLFSTNIEGVILSMPPIAFLSSWAISKKKIKLIADVEDLWPLFLIEMGMKNPIAIHYMNFASVYTYKKADAIEAVSIGMLKYIEKNIDTSNKLVWLSPLGVNIDKNLRIQTSLIKNKAWRKDLKIFYIGAHGKANALDKVFNTIKAFNDLCGNDLNNKKISFIFIGDGDEKEHLKELKLSLNLKNVFLENPISGNEVLEYLKLSDICLTNLKRIQSFKLVRPNKIFQYMAVAKPIICGIWGESEEIVKEAHAGICVNFEEPAKAAKMIMEFINNNNYKKNYGSAGYEYIIKNGNREDILEEYYKKLKSCLE